MTKLNLNLPAAGNAAAAEDKVPATLWLNVGYWADFTTSHGEVERKFVSLPVGIPLDTMKRFDISKINDDDFRKFQEARLELLDTLIKDLNENLDGGNEVELGGLSIVGRKVRDKTNTPAGVNEIAAQRPTFTFNKV